LYITGIAGFTEGVFQRPQQSVSVLLFYTGWLHLRTNRMSSCMLYSP